MMDSPIIDTTEIAFRDRITLNGLVRVSVANLHKGPSFTFPVVTQALMGTSVKIIQTKDDWLYIQLPDGYLGWVSETVNIVSDENYEVWTKAPKLIITERQGYCFSSAKENGIVSDIVIGDIFTIKAESETHYQVIYPDNRNGFVRKSFAQPFNQWISTRNPTESSVIETAKLFTGIPYLWGGFSSKGVDCSGFVKMVYFLNGIMLPRDADMQANVGLDIEIDPDFKYVKPGDLLFFGRKGPDDLKIPITHVGLSLGNKRYMQSSGDVHISSFNPDDPEFDMRRSESIVKIKRILGSEDLKTLDMVTGYKDLICKGRRDAVAL
jgi:cell wall-associated NlpC family hydrolase